ncbi:MAG: sodium/proton-translocating pyrophosphatase [Polyangiaceae bacterium]
MTQFGLILALESSGLVFALLLTRWLATRDGGGAELRRIAGALSRAVDAFLSEQLRVIALGAGLAAAVAFGIHAALAPAAAVLSRLEVAFWAALGLACGAACTALASRAAARLAVSGSLRALGGARTSADAGLAVAMRAAGGSALVVEGLAVIGLCLPFTLLYAMKGGLSADAPTAASLFVAVVAVAPGFGLGAGLGALIVQRAGSVFHNAGDIAADLAGERDAGLDHDDARNPAVVTDLVGDYVGVAARRAAHAFLSATLVNLAIALLGAALVKLHPEDPRSVLPIVFLPALVRSFGIVSTAFSVMTVRTDEQGDVVTSLWRGQATHTLIALGSSAGVAHWLLGPRAWPFIIASAVGLLGLTAAAHLTRLRFDRRVLAVRDVSESLRVGDAAAIAQGLASGLRGGLAPLAALGSSMTAATWIASRTDTPLAALTGFVLVVAAMASAGPFALALGTYAPIVDAARGVGSLSPRGIAPEVSRRTARLDDAGFVGAAMGQFHAFVIAAASVLAATVAALSTDPAAVANLTEPAVAWCGALGLGVALAYAGDSLRHGMTAARSVTLEVERQLRVFPRQRGRARVPEDFTPSYKACLDLSTRSAFRRLLPVVLAVVSVPAVLVLLLRLAAPGTAQALTRQSLVGMLVVGALASLAFGLFGEGARLSLSASRRLAKASTPSSDVASALGGEAFADALGHLASPAALLAIQACAAAALVAFSLLVH